MSVAIIHIKEYSELQVTNVKNQAIFIAVLLSYWNNRMIPKNWNVDAIGFFACLVKNDAAEILRKLDTI